MKKIYLTLGLGLLLLGANAQQKVKIKQKFTPETVVKSNARNGHSTTQSVIFSDDFSVPTNWTMTHPVGTADFTIGTTGGTGTYSLGVINSTTSANGFALFDSDADCSGSQVAEMTTTNSFSTLTHTAVRLKFQQLYGRWYDSTRVYISNNGTTWTNFPVNEQYVDANTSADISPNPDYVTVDISSVAANQATVWVRFTYYSPSTVTTWSTNAGCGYNWLIDDVVVEDIPAIDAAITKTTISAPDCDLTNSEKVVIDIKNNGIAAMTGFNVSYKVNALPMVTETYTGSVAAGAAATYTFAATADFSAPGVVQGVATAITLTGDSDPSNDVDTVYTENLVPTVDALSENFDGTSAMLGWAFAGANQSAWYFSGVNHSAPAALGFNNGAAIVTGIDDWTFTSCVNLTAGTTYFLDYWGVVPTSTVTTYDALITTKIGNDNTVAAMTNNIGSDVLNQTTYTLFHNTFMVPSTGTYNVGFHVQPNNQDTWFRIDDVVLGIDATNGIGSAHTKDLSLSPNPTTGVLNIATSANASVEFYNAMGQHVMSKTLTTGANSIDMSNLSDGVYSVRVMQNNKLTVTKVIKAN